MTPVERFRVLVMFTVLFGVLSSASGADPATSSSERIAKYGVWSVVKKPATFATPTGQGGRYFLCSAAHFAQNSSLEFEAKNDKAWSVYVAAQGWNYRYDQRSLTIKSGSQEIRISRAVYGGSMISAMSHDLSGGKPVSIGKLTSLIAQGEPISIFDNRGRKLVTFPNNGSDLTNAFSHAIKCSLEGVKLLQQRLKDATDERRPDGAQGNGEDGTETLPACVPLKGEFGEIFKIDKIDWPGKDGATIGESFIVYGVFNAEGTTAVCGFHMSKGQIPGGSLDWYMASSKIKSGSRVLIEDLRYFHECKQTDETCLMCATCKKTAYPFRPRYRRYEFVPGTDVGQRNCRSPWTTSRGEC